MSQERKIKEQQTDPVAYVTIKVLDCPNLGIKTWRERGFTVDFVFRTPRFSYFAYPVKPVLKESLVGNYELLFEGSIFKVTEKMERTLEKVSYTVFAIELVLFAVAMLVWQLRLMSASLVVMALMFLIIESFTPLMLRKYTEAHDMDRKRIPVSSLEKVVLDQKSGNLMLSWTESGSKAGFSFRLDHGRASELLNTISSKLADKSIVSIIGNK